jgi:hydrogenase maturation protease
MNPFKLRIICIGNALHSNDGVGLAVFERLSHADLPECVDVFDGGIGGLTLLPLFKGVQQVLLVDLIKTEKEVGSVSLYENVVMNLPIKGNLNAEHGGDLTSVLSMLPIYLQEMPKVDLLGVSARNIDYFDYSLQSQVEQVIDAVCTDILQYIDSHVLRRQGALS